MKIAQKKKLRKWIIPAVTAAVIFALGLGGYLILAPGWSGNSKIKNDVDYSPATETDKTLNNDLKNALPGKKEVEEADKSTSEENASVTPVITAWGQPSGPGTDFKLNGFVPGIVEADGTCSLLLTKGNKKVTVAKDALQDAQNTSCGQLTIPYAELTDTGVWSAVLSYSSSSSSGSSAATQVTIK